MYAPTKRKLTADEYQRMGEVGILHEDDRVELLDGELYETPPIGDGHVGRVNRFDYFFNRRVGDQALVSVQNPIRLSEHSEPQPDIMLLRPRPHFYGTAKARPQDVLLLVEVAESSLAYDRQKKLPLYAAVGIPELWIVNLVEQLVEVYREPVGDRYAVVTRHGPGEELRPALLPEVAIRVEEILG